MGEILFLAHRMPFPPNRGDKIRSYHLLKGLAQIAPVHVGTFAETSEDWAEEHVLSEIADSYHLLDRSTSLSIAGARALLSRRPVSISAWDDTSMHAWVAETLSKRAIDIIFVFSGQMGQYVPDDFSGRVIIDLCDVDSAKFGDYATTYGWPKRALFAREERLLSVEEDRLAHRADHTLLISEEEAALLKSRMGQNTRCAISSLRNGIDTAFFDPDTIAPQTQISGDPGPHLIFTGQMDYPPNESAAIWAIDTFMPAFLQRHPTAQLHIVGRSPTAALTQRNGQNGARIWGEVPDVRPFLAAADLALIPLKIARGVQNKVLEAMAMQRCVLLTPEAATGIAGQDGKEFVIAAAASETVDQADQLIQDAARRTAIGAAAREFVKSHMSWSAVYAQLAIIVSGNGNVVEPRNVA